MPPVLGRTKYDRVVSRKLTVYVVLQYALVIAATFSLLMWHHGVPRSVLVVGSAAVLGALVAIGALLERRVWVKWLELGRLALGGLAIAMLLSSAACRRDRRVISVRTLEGESAVLPLRVAEPPGAADMHLSTHTVEAAGKERKYLLIEPSRLERGKLYPLVLVFHGDGGGMTSFHEGYPFERASGVEAVVAYPDGLGFTWDLETKLENRDVKLVDAIVEELLVKIPIARNKIFATGYSSGGFLSNVIACQRPGLLRAIASNAGGAPYKQLQTWPNGYAKCPGQEPIAMLALHGESDFGVSLDSGRFSAEYWAYVNGCKTDEMETSGYKECHVYRGCPTGKAVGFCPVPGLGHWVWERAAQATWTFFKTQ